MRSRCARIAAPVVFTLVFVVSTLAAGESAFAPVRVQVGPAAGAVTAHSSGTSKIDAPLRLAIANESRLRAGVFAKSGTSAIPMIAVDQAKDGTLMMPVFVRTTDVASTREQIASYGGVVTVTAGDVLVARLPLHAIETLAGRSEVRRIEASTVSRPLLDLARREAKVDQIQAGTGLRQPFKGEGVIVGVVDSGIDWSHPDFKNASGQTRILSIWDQTLSGKPPAGFTRGYECTAADINASNCPERDTDGHGTHVAGIAAGNGRGSSNKYLGMAPAADIVFVKAGDKSFSDVNVVEAIAYIFAKAQALGKPAVVNLSLGGHFSPHDGTSAYESAVSSLITRGNLITAANGNEGDTRIHVGYDVKGTSYSDGYSTYLFPGANESTIVIDVWLDNGSAAVGLQALPRTGGPAFFGSGGIPAGGGLARTPITNNNSLVGYATIETDTGSGGSKRTSILIEGDANALSTVAFELYSYGSGHLDAWVVTGGEFTRDADPLTAPGDTNFTVGSPATANNIVAVGSYVTKESWTDIDGSVRQYQNTTLGNISPFSSIGPTRDGRRRPIISAPGQAVASALSNASTKADDRPFYLPGNLYRIEQGTSMACPVVTGILALMLQANPGLTSGDAYSFLRSNAVKDGFTTNQPNNTWGDGKVDGLAAIKAAGGSGPGTGPGPTVCTPSSTTICLSGGRFAVSVQFRDGGTLKNATAIKYTDGSGLFWFFGADNIEILMKVLNACGLNNRIWVFTAATTNVEYHLKVVDTKNGSTKTYDNAAGPPAPAITDTGAFATCP